jgi:hypothetical protein
MESSDGSARTLPQIVENYRDYEPPRQFRGVIEDLLADVPAKYLVGLKTILLTNQKALTRDQRRQKTSGRKGRRSGLAEARGAYFKATKSSSAYVLIMVDNTLIPWPTWVLRAPLLRHAAISEVLYHEIGHHIHQAIEPVYDGKENVADKWQRKLDGRFKRRRYWYLMPLLYPGAKLTRLLSKTAAWKKMEASTRG